MEGIGSQYSTRMVQQCQRWRLVGIQDGGEKEEEEKEEEDSGDNAVAEFSFTSRSKQLQLCGRHVQPRATKGKNRIISPASSARPMLVVLWDDVYHMMHNEFRSQMSHNGGVLSTSHEGPCRESVIKEKEGKGIGKKKGGRNEIVALCFYF